MKYLVTDIGGTFTKYAVMDEECRFYEKGKIPTAKESVEEFLDMLTELFDNYREVAEGLAISAPGMIDSERGFMYNAGAILCVENLDIVRILEERLKVPVTIENDAKSAALAEMWRGSLQDARMQQSLSWGQESAAPCSVMGNCSAAGICSQGNSAICCLTETMQ